MCYLHAVFAVVFLFLMCVTVCCCCHHREARMNHSDALDNPVKLIWGVVQFARKKKEHIFRSAFTYNEMPSRLDLAKQRYGGPFTTREVEDVKNFWQILILLLSLIGFQLREDISFLSIAMIPGTNAIKEVNEESSYFPRSIFNCSWAVTALVIIVGIPVYQLVVRPFFSKYVPRMLMRMMIGLDFVLLSLLVTTVISQQALSGSVVYENKTTYYFSSSENGFCDVDFCTGGIILNSSARISSICSAVHHNWGYVQCNSTNGCVYHEYFLDSSPLAPVIFCVLMGIPQALNGLAAMLVFMTVLEFIFVQASHKMQGLLICLWYALQSINVGIGVIGYISCAVFHWAYYAVKLFWFSSQLFCFFVYRESTSIGS